MSKGFCEKLVPFYRYNTKVLGIEYMENKFWLVIILSSMLGKVWGKTGSC